MEDEFTIKVANEIVNNKNEDRSSQEGYSSKRARQLNITRGRSRSLSKKIERFTVIDSLNFE